jgi:hypothetical protein
VASGDKTSGFLKQVCDIVTNERDRSVIIGLRDAMLGSLERVGGLRRVKSMDVWCAVLGCK